MNSEIVGIIAGALSCTTFLPQVIKTWKSKSTKDVSLTMFVIASVGNSSLAGLRHTDPQLFDYSNQYCGADFFADDAGVDFPEQGKGIGY